MRQRSPRHPRFSLQEAVEKIEDVYPRIKRQRMDKESFVQHFGYAGLSGASLAFISTLSQYGLLSGKGEEGGISKDGELICLEARDSPERLGALERCAMRPAVFKEIIGQVGDNLPADEPIRQFLEQREFSKAAADSVTRALRDTRAYIDNARRAYKDEHERAQANALSHAKAKADKIPRQDVGGASQQDLESDVKAQTLIQDTFNLAEGRVVLQYPNKLSAPSMEYLKAWLELQIKKVDGYLKGKQGQVPINDDALPGGH